MKKDWSDTLHCPPPDDLAIWSKAEVNTAWVTGAGGMIGSYLVRIATQTDPSWRVIGLTRPDLDLTDLQAVRDRFLRENPRLIIHCAALSKSTDCENGPSLAKKINVVATQALAELATDIPFVFFSTDLVFDGGKGGYRENDLINPLSVYGETKAVAEEIVLRNPKHLVIRTSLNAGVSPSGDRAFNEQLRNDWRAGKTTRLFVDEFRSPIAALETARAVWELVAKGATGLFHVAGSERLSRWQIGQLIAARYPDLNPKLEPASITEYKGPPRSPDTSLNNAKAEALLGRSLPGFTAWLQANPSTPL
jgi:dTDP-4-dehydrorhamnose reductase